MFTALSRFCSRHTQMSQKIGKAFSARQAKQDAKNGRQLRKHQTNLIVMQVPRPCGIFGHLRGVRRIDGSGRTPGRFRWPHIRAWRYVVDSFLPRGQGSTFSWGNEKAAPGKKWPSKYQTQKARTPLGPVHYSPASSWPVPATLWLWKLLAIRPTDRHKKIHSRQNKSQSELSSAELFPRLIAPAGTCSFPGVSAGDRRKNSASDWTKTCYRGLKQKRCLRWSEGCAFCARVARTCLRVSGLGEVSREEKEQGAGGKNLERSRRERRQKLRRQQD